MKYEISERDLNELSSAFLCLESKNEMKKFLKDLCSTLELTNLVERFKIAQRVYKGVPYRKISENLGCSTTTVTRVAAWVNQGRGGYQTVFDRLED
jgi:TrpR-related protein YerC/YecD